MKRLLLLCGLLLSLPTLTAAQDTQLTVTVRDNIGVLPGAVVDATSRATGRTLREVADERGAASFTNLPGDGQYDLRVSFPGFSDINSRITLEPGGVRQIEIVMSLLRVSEQTTVTTANRREQVLLEVADPTVVVDATDIADTGSRTAKDLLVELAGAGVQVQAGGGQGHLSINGIPNSGVLVLVDGRRYLGKDSNGNFNLEDLMLSGVERVEIVRGAGSALYGSDALGGVVNFVTRRSRAEGFTSTTELGGGSYADWRFNQSASWRSARGGVKGSLGYRTYDGFDLSESNPQTVGQPESTWASGDVAADFALSNRVRLSVAADYSKRDITNYFFSGPTQLPASVYDSQRQLTRWSVSPTIDVDLSPTTSLAAVYTAGRYHRDETRVFLVGGQIAPQAPWREWSDELKLTARQAFRGWGQEHLLQAGYEYRGEQLRRPTLTVTDPSRRVDVAWLQQEVGLGSQLRLTGGLRLDRYSDFGNEISPKVSLVYSPAARHRVRASAGHGFRPPYFGELFLNTPPSFVGNPDLKPETANTLDVGYSYAGPLAEVSADVFRARVHNGITFNLAAMPFTYGNLRAYTSRGSNVSISVPLPGGFVPGISYSFNERVDQAGVEIGGYARHATYLKLLWSNPRLGLRANLRGQLMGRVPPAVDGSYQPAYDVWSAQVAKTITTTRTGRALSVYVQATNLGNTRDIFLRTADGTPVQENFQVWIAPRTIQAGLTLDLNWTR